MLKTFKSGRSAIIELGLGDETIACTPQHRFYREGWVAATELKPGDRLSSREGQPVELKAVRRTSLIESGVVASFSRPGGNVTGVYMLADELDVKRFELLLQAVPKTRTVAMLGPGSGWNISRLTEDLRQIAKGHGAQFLISDVSPDGYDATFAAMSKAKVEAVLVPSFPRFYREHRLIVEAAARHRIPAIYEWGDMARAGGLMAYGPVIAELNRRVATYVDKILKGAKPGVLPVEQPANFELVINLRAARTLGLTIPQALLLRADEVIQ